MEREALQRELVEFPGKVVPTGGRGSTPIPAPWPAAQHTASVVSGNKGWRPHGLLQTTRHKRHKPQCLSPAPSTLGHPCHVSLKNAAFYLLLMSRNCARSLPVPPAYSTQRSVFSHVAMWRLARYSSPWQLYPFPSWWPPGCPQPLMTMAWVVTRAPPSVR